MDGTASSSWTTAGDAGQPDYSGFHSISNAELDALLQSYTGSSSSSTNDTNVTGDFRGSAPDFSNEALNATPKISAQDFGGVDHLRSHQSSSTDSNPQLQTRQDRPKSSLPFSTYIPRQQIDHHRTHQNGAAPAPTTANAFFTANGLADSVDWSKVGIPASLSQPSAPQEAMSQFMIPNQMNSSALAFARNQDAGIQPGRASWDGTTTSSPLGYGMPHSGLDPAVHAPHMSKQDSQQGGAALPLGSEGESSDAGNTSTGSTKRRRMTISGSDSLHQAGRGRPHINPHQSQDSQPQHLLPQYLQAAMPRPRKHLEQHSSSASSSSPFPRGTSASGLINSKELEQMASATLQRANAENRRTTDSDGHLSALPAKFAGTEIQQIQQQQQQLNHHISHHQHHQQQAQRPPLHRQRSATSDQDGSYRSIQKRFSGPDLSNVFEPSRHDASISNAQQTSYGGPAYHTTAAIRTANPGHLGGSAASHPPGLGSSVLKGQDPAVTGTAAANDFTRRKGWTGRVVDELLDFAHVLDTEGNFMYATNSVQTLTGWKPAELKGQNIYDLVHPQDLPALRRELHSAIEDPSKEITMYYRIKRSPVQIESRAKSRLKDASHERHRLERSRSSSDAATSPTDTSSLQTPSDSNSGAPSGSADQSSAHRPSGKNAAAAGEIDPDAEWVTMEMTGHAYFPPTAVAKERAEELQQAADERNQGDVLGSFMRNSRATADLGPFFDPNDVIRTGDEPSSNRGSLDEDRKSRGAGQDNRSPKARTYDLPLEREKRAQCLFCSCRVYPTKSVLLLDSFLELKMENEKLRLQLEQLNLSEEREGIKQTHPGSGPNSQRPSLDGNAHDIRRDQGGSLVMSPDGGIGERSQDGPEGRTSLDINQMDAAQPRPGDPSALQGGVGAAERALHASTAGLSRGVSTTSGQVLTSERFGASSEDLEPASSSSPSGPDSSKKKKGKAQDDDEDRVCTDCGRTDSPEWRKGPLGPKTLCNACGLRYAKKVKRAPASLHMNGPGTGYPGASSPTDMANSPPRPSSAMMHASLSQAAARAMGGVDTPMASMHSSHSSRPIFSTMNSFATDISPEHRPSFGGAGGMSGSFRSVPTETGNSFQQMSQQQHLQTPFQSDISASHDINSQSYGMPQFSPDYSMSTPQPQSAAAPAMRHQSSSSYGGYPSFQPQQQQQEAQQRALQHHQQQEMQQMQQRHQHQIRQQMQQQLSQQHQQQGSSEQENGNGGGSGGW